MAIESITKDDLHEFRTQLLEEVKNLLLKKRPVQKEWLKSYEVRKLLNISPGTLQNLRINGTLTYTKIESIIFYNSLEIEHLMQTNRIHHRKS